MSVVPRLLIITASFGEGHNSAARNLALAMNSMGAETQVSDPCELGSPRFTKLVNKGYRCVTNHFPKIWAAIYRSTDRCDLSKPHGPLLRAPEDALALLIQDFHPTAIVSTFPLYPYLLKRIFLKSGMSLPVFTVITDSIEINAAWLRLPTGRWLVTDHFTREVMILHGLPAEKIMDLGFPVNPSFATLQPIEASDTCRPFRVLYFPTAQVGLLQGNCRAILDASSVVTLTLVLGRNMRSLYAKARGIKDAYPSRVRIIGWTRKVPQLLNRHHLIVGKAGGATVHEAIAARCPMLIHHLVPGQEEGNLCLLEHIKAGSLADSPTELRKQISNLLADDAHAWRSMKNALIQHDRIAGGLAAARFILDELSSQS
jgi:processive 1,2-diacylglycerol beta-glucosyltransferase